MSAEYDLIIRNGTIYDGSGSPPVTGDVAVNGETIAAIGHVAQRARPGRSWTPGVSRSRRASSTC